MTLAHTFHRWRFALGGLAAALVLAFLVGFTPQGQTAAAQFLAQFRSQRFAPVTFDPKQTTASPLFQLERLGTVQGGPPNQQSTFGAEVKTVAEASQRVGFQVKQPDPATLPAGLARTPSIMVTPATEFRFTFDRDKARSYFQSIGHPEVSLPDRFHGASLVVSVPAAALLTYTGSDNSMGLLIGETGELTVGVDGQVSLDELREFLLGLPGLPPETVRQLRAIQDWRTTVPIPIPVDQIRWQQTTIAGGQGLLLADNSGLGSAALWQRDGRVYGVAGPMKAAELQRVADSLR
ncbi:MAG: hypothetical protein HY690_19330 [Chloroflexi bacterium]|nr:hypothetical protein [Chloroflexota bacterium]